MLPRPPAPHRPYLRSWGGMSCVPLGPWGALQEMLLPSCFFWWQMVVADSPGPLALRSSSHILGVLWLRSLCRAAPRCPGRVGGSSPPAGARSRQAERLVSCRQRGRGCALASITSCRKSLHLPRCELTGALPSGCPPLPARAGVSYANRCSRFPN